MRGSAALEADEETAEASMYTDSFAMDAQNAKMNGGAASSGGLVLGPLAGANKNGAYSSGDIKYPANCAMRLGSTPGSAEGDDNDIYEPKQNKKIFRILTVLVYVFTVSFGAILLSLYYLFLWDPYKNTGQFPTQIPSAQTNSPPTPKSSLTATPPSLVTPSPYERRSTLSDEMLDDIVEDLNNGAEPKALAMAIRKLTWRESQSSSQHLENPFFQYEKAQRANNLAKN